MGMGGGRGGGRGGYVPRGGATGAPRGGGYNGRGGIAGVPTGPMAMTNPGMGGMMGMREWCGCVLFDVAFLELPG
jgi:hypothetical protein